MEISPNVPLRLTPEIPGGLGDMLLLLEDNWLADTHVAYVISHRKSLWYLTMIYTDINDSLRIVCRYIDCYNSKLKAETYAKILQKGFKRDGYPNSNQRHQPFIFSAN